MPNIFMYAQGKEKMGDFEKVTEIYITSDMSIEYWAYFENSGTSLNAFSSHIHTYMTII